MPLRACRALIPLVALLAVLPILLRGPSCGHDFDFHLLSWLEAATQFAHGGIPHWAFTPAYNAGEPRFLFYPPLSWTLGGLLGLLLPWQLVPAAFTWIALTASGLSFFSLARRYTTPPAALLGATLYLANPYMLFTAYERTAFGELLAAAFLPLLLAAALERRPRILPIALPLALLWLTNAPAAVLSTYALAFLAALRLILRSYPNPLVLARNVIAGPLLGLSLAAFYILPAAYERRFVAIDMAVTPGMQPADHFLFHRMAGHTPDDLFHNDVVRTASEVALLLLLGIACTLPFARRRLADQPQPDPILPLTALALTIAFLLTPASSLVWTYLPQLRFLQFPWRLSALLGLIFALFAALVLNRYRSWTPTRTLGLTLLFAALLIPAAWLHFHQFCDDEDAVAPRVVLFHSPLGSEPTDEYTPADADPEALQPHDPPFWLLPSPTQPGQENTPAPSVALPGQAPNHLQLTLPQPELLVLNRRQYPAWHLRLNGAEVPPHEPERADGLLTLALPAGTDTVDLVWKAMPDQQAGWALSGLAALSALGLRASKKKLPA